MLGPFPKSLKGRKVFDFVTFKRELGVSPSVNYSFVTDPLPFKGITPICLCYICRTFWNCLSSLNTFNLLGRYWFSPSSKMGKPKDSKVNHSPPNPHSLAPDHERGGSPRPRENTDTTRGLPGFQVGEAHHTGFLQVCALMARGWSGSQAAPGVTEPTAGSPEALRSRPDRWPCSLPCAWVLSQTENSPCPS